MLWFQLTATHTASWPAATPEGSLVSRPTPGGSGIGMVVCTRPVSGSMRDTRGSVTHTSSGSSG
ncbi:MAG: hypothetical protein ACRDLA_08340 [Thermoleophilaceae bacterium]